MNYECTKILRRIQRRLHKDGKHQIKILDKMIDNTRKMREELNK